MHIKRTVNRACAAALCAALCLSLASAGTPAAKAERLLDRYAVLFEGESASYDALPAYGAVAAAWRENGLTEAAADVPVPLGTVAVSGKAAESVQIDGRTGLLLDESTGDAVFSVSVPQDGLYRLEIEYYPQGGSGQAIRRRIALDGKVPFAEAENACLYRRFVYTGDARYNAFGDQLSYAQREERGWMTADLQDVDGKYAAPLLYGLTAGTHTLTLGFVDQPVVIGKITLKASENVPGHAAVSAGYPRGGTAAPIVLQAEDPSAMLWRSDSTLTAYCDTDPATFPAVSDTRPLNAVGGSGWSHGGQEIAYRFTVQTAGCYRLSLRVQQSWSTGMNAYRQILIDGQIPFAELTEYPFSYARGWYTETLHGEDGEPYLFYLTPGEHTLTLRAVMASAVTQAIADVGAITDTISAVYRKILLITGAEPDVNYDYDLEKSIPDLLDTLDDLQERLDAAASLILGVSKKRPAGVSDLYMIRQQLREMRDDPDLIPRRLEDITNSLTTLGSLIGTLSSTPLGIDEIRLTPEGQTVPQRLCRFPALLHAGLRPRGHLRCGRQPHDRRVGVPRDGVGHGDHRPDRKWVRTAVRHRCRSQRAAQRHIGEHRQPAAARDHQRQRPGRRAGRGCEHGRGIRRARRGARSDRVLGLCGRHAALPPGTAEGDDLPRQDLWPAGNDEFHLHGLP